MSQAPPAAPKGGNPQSDAVKSKATTALILAIVGFFCFGIILGPVAIVMGNGAKKMITQQGVGQEHMGLANIATILGWVVTILNILGIVLYVVLMAGMIGAGAGAF